MKNKKMIKELLLIAKEILKKLQEAPSQTPERTSEEQIMLEYLMGEERYED